MSQSGIRHGTFAGLNWSRYGAGQVRLDRVGPWGYAALELDLRFWGAGVNVGRDSRWYLELLLGPLTLTVAVGE